MIEKHAFRVSRCDCGCGFILKVTMITEGHSVRGSSSFASADFAALQSDYEENFKNRYRVDSRIFEKIKTFLENITHNRRLVVEQQGDKWRFQLNELGDVLETVYVSLEGEL